MANPSAPGGVEPPIVIGRYELVAPLASGALGELWRARIASGPEQGRMVGLRRILRGPAFDSGVLERITDAGFAAMELRHPRVLAVLDVVVAGDQIAIVSELFGGAVLKSLLRAGNGGVRPVIPAPTAVRLAIDLLEALQAVQRPWLDPPRTNAPLPAGSTAASCRTRCSSRVLGKPCSSKSAFLAAR
jgi:hypothetical protein